MNEKKERTPFQMAALIWIVFYLSFAVIESFYSYFIGKIFFYSDTYIEYYIKDIAFILISLHISKVLVLMSIWWTIRKEYKKEIHISNKIKNTLYIIDIIGVFYFINRIPTHSFILLVKNTPQGNLIVLFLNVIGSSILFWIILRFITYFFIKDYYKNNSQGMIENSPLDHF